MFRRSLTYFPSAFAMIGLFALVTVAQVTTANVVGRVTDATGAVVSGAHVTIDHQGTHQTRSGLTSISGDYVLNLLPPGRYTLRIEATGFKT